MSGQGQEFNIFVIIKWEQKPLEEPSYDESAHRLLKVKKEEKEEEKKSVIKKEIKNRQKKKTAVKKERSISSV